MKRIGMLTSGGDCQALNAVMYAFAKSYCNLEDDVVFYGFLDGYYGLMHNKYRKMKLKDFENIDELGGTILGSSRQPFKMMEVIEDGFDKVKAMVDTYKKNELDALVVLGGNGSLKSANLLASKGCNVIGMPKTIDNDTWGTDITFGFQSSVEIAANAVDQVRTTATSHHRVFVVELMGHKVGWITLYGAIAGKADMILLPEIPYDPDVVLKTVKKALKNKDNGTYIIACAEGALTKKEAKMKKKARLAYRQESPYNSAAEEITAMLKENLPGKYVGMTVVGHTQRGGRPCVFDKEISYLIGAKGAMLCKEKDFGKMVSLQNMGITAVPLEEIAGKLKFIDPEGDTVVVSRALGISFGDK